MLNTNPGIDWGELFKGIFDWCNVRKWPSEMQLMAFLLGLGFIGAGCAFLFGDKTGAIWIIRISVGISLISYVWIFIVRYVLKKTK